MVVLVLLVDVVKKVVVVVLMELLLLLLPRALGLMVFTNVAVENVVERLVGRMVSDDSKALGLMSPPPLLLLLAAPWLLCGLSCSGSSLGSVSGPL